MARGVRFSDGPQDGPDRPVGPPKPLPTAEEDTEFKARGMPISGQYQAEAVDMRPRQPPLSSFTGRQSGGINVEESGESLQQKPRPGRSTPPSASILEEADDQPARDFPSGPRVGAQPQHEPPCHSTATAGATMPGQDRSSSGSPTQRSLQHSTSPPAPLPPPQSSSAFEQEAFDFEALAGSEDIPLGVRYLAALKLAGGSEAGSSCSPASPGSRGQSREAGHGHQRWHHSTIPSLHSGVTAAMPAVITAGGTAVATVSVPPSEALLTHLPLLSPAASKCKPDTTPVAGPDGSCISHSAPPAAAPAAVRIDVAQVQEADHGGQDQLGGMSAASPSFRQPSFSPRPWYERSGGSSSPAGSPNLSLAWLTRYQVDNSARLYGGSSRLGSRGEEGSRHKHEEEEGAHGRGGVSGAGRRRQQQQQHDDCPHAWSSVTDGMALSPRMSTRLNHRGASSAAAAAGLRPHTFSEAATGVGGPTATTAAVSTLERLKAGGAPYGPRAGSVSAGLAGGTPLSQGLPRTFRPRLLSTSPGSEALALSPGI